MSLFKLSEVYTPKYQNLVAISQEHEKAHWVEAEARLDNDVMQYKSGAITDDEKDLIKNILRLFTASDLNVATGYIDNLMPVFKNNEARGMLASFAARELIHQRGYSLLNDTLGYGEEFHKEFLDIFEMREKAEYQMFAFNTGDKVRDTILSLAKQMMIEGVSLFASFAMLLNFDRKGRMQGCNDIVRWSQLDESMHCEGLAALFHLAVQEKPEVVTDDFKKEIYTAARKIIELEDSFIDFCYKGKEIANLSAPEVKQYIRYVANIRLKQLGLKANWEGLDKNPLPWVDALMGSSLTSFFERAVVDYSKSNLTGEWVY